MVEVTRLTLVRGSLCRWLTSIPAAMAALFMNASGKDRREWGKRLTDIHKTGHLVYLITKILLW